MDKGRCGKLQIALGWESNLQKANGFGLFTSEALLP